MEHQVNNLINFGIGCLSTLSDKYKGLSQGIRNGVSDLVSEGEKSQATSAVRIREIAHEATDFFQRGERTHA